MYETNIFQASCRGPNNNKLNLNKPIIHVVNIQDYILVLSNFSFFVPSRYRYNVDIVKNIVINSNHMSYSNTLCLRKRFPFNNFNFYITIIIAAVDEFNTINVLLLLKTLFEIIYKAQFITIRNYFYLNSTLEIFCTTRTS